MQILDTFKVAMEGIVEGSIAGVLVALSIFIPFMVVSLVFFFS